MSEKLTDIELDALVIRIQDMSAKGLRNALKSNMFSAKEKPYIEEYIPRKIKEERNETIKLYHRRKAPDGKEFKVYEVPVLESKGWVDSPTKIKKDVRDKIADAVKTVMKIIFAFWCKEYKWILGFIVMIISLYIAYLKLVLLLSK